jgi:hypothetical protein
LLHFCGRGKKGTSFCRNIIPAKRNSWKVTLGKEGTWKGIPSFLQEVGSNPPGFLELESQKKGTQKRTHNLDNQMQSNSPIP